jgi:hypothetical protein
MQELMKIVEGEIAELEDMIEEFRDNGPLEHCLTINGLIQQKTALLRVRNKMALRVGAMVWDN